MSRHPLNTNRVPKLLSNLDLITELKQFPFSLLWKEVVVEV